MRQSTARKRKRKLLPLLAGLCVLCALVIVLVLCLRVDTSDWVYHRFEDLGIAVRLPEDLSEIDTEGALYSAQNETVRVEIVRSSVLYPDEAAMAAHLGSSAELLESNGVPLVRHAGAEETSLLTCYRISPAGDVYFLALEMCEGARPRRAAAVAKAIAGTICSADAPEASGAVTHESAVLPAETDYLVLVNERTALPEGWAETLDLVSTPNSLGEPVFLERTACKAFFALQRALAEDGLSVELRGGYQDVGTADAHGIPGNESEHSTALALDLLLPDGANEAQYKAVHRRLADFGFILRYPQGGKYYTGRAYEPGHIRYVGAEAAREIAGRGITLEEYLGRDPASIDFLVLVNAQTALPEGWEEQIETVHMTNRHGEDIEVERTAFAAYEKLAAALAAEGVHLDINSAYRSVASQQEIVESFTVKYGADYVKAYVAVPGYSEHHTGLAIDLYLESPDVWAKIHAKLADCGFILRYPQGKEAVTGYAYEPWHIRYVGVETAREITARCLALEEYLLSP